MTGIPALLDSDSGLLGPGAQALLSQVCGVVSPLVEDGARHRPASCKRKRALVTAGIGRCDGIHISAIAPAPAALSGGGLERSPRRQPARNLLEHCQILADNHTCSQMAVFLALNAIEFGLWRDRSQAPPDARAQTARRTSRAAASQGRTTGHCPHCPWRQTRAVQPLRLPSVYGRTMSTGYRVDAQHDAQRPVEPTRFSRHLRTVRARCPDGQNPCAVPAGVPPQGGRPGPRRTHGGRAGTRARMQRPDHPQLDTAEQARRATPHRRHNEQRARGAARAPAGTSPMGQGTRSATERKFHALVHAIADPGATSHWARLPPATTPRSSATDEFHSQCST